MNVLGVDFSSHHVDCVSVPLEGAGSPVWTRWTLTGSDAFERTRSVADVMPGRASVFYQDTLAVGIEHPAGRHGVGPLLRIQGAVLSRIPARMLVVPLPPGKWRALNGLKGNASKADVKSWAIQHWWGGNIYRAPVTQDAYDAYCIALATRTLLAQQQEAAA